jgi:ABC-type amino acid transport system permease subunit
MEVIAGFMAGLFLNVPALLICIVCGILWEYNEHHGWAVFAGLVTAAISFFMFNVPLNVLLIAIGVYVALGFGWSFWRYSRYANKRAQELKKSNYSDRDIIREVQPSNNVDKITIWVIIWPFSVIECLTGDIVHLIQQAISNWFYGVYRTIFKSAMKAAGVNIEA